MKRPIARKFHQRIGSDRLRSLLISNGFYDFALQSDHALMLASLQMCAQRGASEESIDSIEQTVERHEIAFMLRSQAPSEPMFFNSQRHIKQKVLTPFIARLRSLLMSNGFYDFALQPVHALMLASLRMRAQRRASEESIDSIEQTVERHEIAFTLRNRAPSAPLFFNSQRHIKQRVLTPSL